MHLAHVTHYAVENICGEKLMRLPDADPTRIWRCRMELLLLMSAYLVCSAALGVAAWALGRPRPWWRAASISFARLSGSCADRHTAHRRAEGRRYVERNIG
jgi:hypothetical protein